MKKALRDDGGVLTDERRAALAAELGDVLWYVAQLATEAGLDLDTIAEENLSKLLSRQERSVLAGQRRHALAEAGLAQRVVAVEEVHEVHDQAVAHREDLTRATSVATPWPFERAWIRVSARTRSPSSVSSSTSKL